VCFENGKGAPGGYDIEPYALKLGCHGKDWPFVIVLDADKNRSGDPKVLPGPERGLGIRQT